jgi:hypothetical protein
MFFLILLSVIQICFLPGFILFILLNRKSSETKMLLIPVFSFALSLIVNYLIVIILIYFHIYIRSVLFIVQMLELVILLALYFFRREEFNIKSYRYAFRGLIKNGKQLISYKKGAFEKITSSFILLSLLLFAALILIMLLNIGKIFNTWDAIFSWNRWAIDFFNNKIPVSTYHYPQLIPANWSVSYIIFGYPLQFIPKAIMPLFLILVAYSFLVLGIQYKRMLFFPAMILLFLSFNKLNWTDGFVDVPVAFFSILIFICLSLLKDEMTDKGKHNLILTAILFVCGSAVTKQAGIFLVGVFPLILIILSRGSYQWNIANIVKAGLFFFAMILVIIIPYYFYAQMAIKQGIAASEVPYVTKEIYNGASYFERVINASKFFSNVFTSRVLFIICLLPFFVSFTNPTLRSLNLVLVVPYTLIWALFFSCDLRNAAIIIPFLCLGIGGGIEIIINRFFKTPSIPNYGL